ncbi:MAG: MOSC domain-containing protein, partial [Methylocystis sp.]
ADWPLARLFALLYVRPRAFDELSEMAVLPELADSWRALARRRIESRKVEDWRRRLGG